MSSIEPRAKQDVAPVGAVAPAPARCKNCDAVLLGRFCAHCSQAADVHVPTTRELAHDLLEGFTKRHGVHDLVWFEMHADIQDAITREKQIKGWNRAWKIRLIEKGNPNWDDLYARFLA